MIVDILSDLTYPQCRPRVGIVIFERTVVFGTITKKTDRAADCR